MTGPKGREPPGQFFFFFFFVQYCSEKGEKDITSLQKQSDVFPPCASQRQCCCPSIHTLCLSVSTHLLPGRGSSLRIPGAMPVSRSIIWADLNYCSWGAWCAFVSRAAQTQRKRTSWRLSAAPCLDYFI